MNDLHVFEWGPDHIIAREVEEARAILVEHYGGDLEDFEPAEVEKVPDDQELRIIVNEQGQIDDSGGFLSLTARQWVEREGRGFLCTSEL